MELRYFQRGFNYSQDGPGNRLVYHLCGCNMRCPWCANPEGMELGAATCRREAVEVAAAFVISARALFFDNGGLTLTGGEATLQFEAVKALLARVRAAGIKTCLETNATHERLTELFPLLDDLIADYKHPDSAAHRTWTGVGNERVERNLRAAAASGIPLQLRVPLIHGVNDDDAALAGFVAFFSEIDREGMTVEFLRYHEYGKEKWEKLGRTYQMRDAFVKPERAELFERVCQRAGLRVIRT